MSLKSLLLVGALGYGYLYLKNNNIVGQQQQSSTGGGIPNYSASQPSGAVTKTSAIYEVLINSIPISNADKYRVVYDVIFDSKRYTLFVLKNWIRTDAPKPFITQQEYNALTDVQKQKYRINMYKAGTYAWYQVEKTDSIYTVDQKEPAYPPPGLPLGEVLSRPVPIGFIPAYSYPVNPSDASLIKGSGINITTPVNPSTAQPKALDTEIGITVPLSRLQQLKKTLYGYGITDLYKVGSQFIDGVQVDRYVINPAIGIFAAVFNRIKDSGIVYDVQRMVSTPTVKSADIYHPEQLTLATIVQTAQTALHPISTILGQLVA